MLTKENRPDRLAIKRLLRAVRYSRTSAEFLEELVDHPKWYLVNAFYRRQTKPFFIAFFNQYKGVR